MKQVYPLLKTISSILFLVFVMAYQSFSQSCKPKGNEVSYGTNNMWIGYVYQGKNFGTYKGYVTEGTAASPDFDVDFGGNQVYYSTNNCSVYTEEFSVRYKLTKTFTNGTYVFTVSGDDGYRLSLDGGVTWVIDNWKDQSYTAASYSVQLNGTYNMVLEYYENHINNRLTFTVSTTCTGNSIDPDIYGANNTWIGYLYQGKSFEALKGTITVGNSYNANFDENFGGSNNALPTSACAVQTEQFSARFRLQTTLAPATYVITVGGDDGFRLSLDGGNTWVIDEWKYQSYKIKSYTAQLSGTYNLVLEYFENGGDNRVSFEITSSSTLPVKLTSFTAKAINEEKVQLNWQTSAAINFDHYVVERSTDGRTFSGIQTVAGKSSNSIADEMYSYTDVFNYNGTVYYRLAMVDVDGTINYSNVVAVALNNGSAVSVKMFPTIIENGNLYIEAGAGSTSGKLELFDMNGRRLLVKECVVAGGRQQVSIKQGNIAQGSYMVRFSNNKKIIAVKKVIVK